ncbi:hypothetical protein J2X31_000629 [Flavobacterium arsenatis]|uniref:Uncharacterized protein n=1 Tax=Flavobacterium arsenatis TaxID=1484332 RepID=A0ABU1TKX7_9FLAO|nr:hypothetical protein [Flavobacterium arsenatis]
MKIHKSFFALQRGWDSNHFHFLLYIIISIYKTKFFTLLELYPYLLMP